MRNAVIGALRVNLGIDSAQFTKGLQDATKQLDRVGKQMQAVGRSMAASLTAPLGLVGAAIIKTAANFEKEMANVRAVLRPTEVEFRLLTRTAEELGRTTKFTAAEAAAGMEMLARNGLKTSQILGGATDATLNLAAAAGSELAPAADAITDIMVNFRGSGENLKQVIDQVTGTLVSSKLGWEDYRLALGQAAGAAGPLGMSFEDMNAALAATAASFSSGVEAGTSLKGFLLKLAPSSKQSKENIKALGLEFWDAAGNMKPLAAIAQELRDKLGGLTKESQTEVLGQLFGQRVIRTALRLMEEGAEGVERFKAAIATGNAEEMAAARLDNLWGAVVLLKSAWEGLSIAIGKSGLMQWARTLVDSIREIVLSLSQASPQMLRFVTVFAGLTAVAGPLLIALGLVASALAAISLPITGVIAVFAAASAAVALWGRDMEQIGKTIGIIFQDIHDSAKQWLVDKFGWVINGVSALVDRMIAAFRWLADKLGLTALAATLKSEFSATAQRLGNDFETIKDIGTSAADTVSDAWTRAGAQMESVAQHAREGWSRMAEEMALSLAPKISTGGPPLLGSDEFDSAASSDAERVIKAMNRDAENAREQMLSEGQRVFEATRTPAEALRIEFERLNTLVKAGAIGFDTYTRAVEQAQNEFSGLNQTAENVSQSFGRSLEGMILDGKNWRDSLSGFLQDIARELLRTAALTPLMNALKGGITSAFGGGGDVGLGSWAASLKGFANGGSFKVGGAGGIDSQLVAFRASPNESVSIDKPGQGRGAPVINMPINIDATGADAAGLARVQAEVVKLKTDMPAVVTQAIRKANNSNVKF
jgi:TP901 family phage tail tape measure protein